MRRRSEKSKAPVAADVRRLRTTPAFPERGCVGDQPQQRWRQPRPRHFSNARASKAVAADPEDGTQPRSCGFAQEEGAREKTIPRRLKRVTQATLLRSLASPVCFALTSLLLLPTLPAAESAPDSAQISEPPITAQDREHWAFQPLKRPEPPRVKNEPQAHNDIDRFILARLEERNLRLAPEASRETLLRRLSFDLIGLPPTPAEIDAFLADDSPDAYEKQVTRLLNSDAYGERWAQHWLDVARFAESDGFEHDKVRADAWRYRDWVIKALNKDLPYDRFIQWQIAGDEISPGNPDATRATGFLVAGPDMPDINLPEERRHTVLNEITSTLGASILGLALHCAECHDHKYDPVSQADFYRARAFFENMAIAPKNKSLPPTFAEKGDEAPVSRFMTRGDFRRPGPAIQPGFLRIVSRPEDRVAPTPIPGRSSGRRAELARWLTRPDHPLTTRVIANRLWLHHFGRALVGTPNDLGTQGDAPTHPALLDWLATEMPRRKWSLKAMHRLIVTSATYRQAGSGEGPEWQVRLKNDPGNELYSRMPRRRLSGEASRDAMLLISGRLNRKAGGPGFRPPLPPEVTVTLLKNQWPVTRDETEHYRRSIYLFARRNLRYPMFDVFDRPDALASCARRNVSTTAPQSLTLFNSEFSLERARDLAGLLLVESPSSPRDWIAGAYRRVFGRFPSTGELATGTAFIGQQAEILRKQNRQRSLLALPEGADEAAPHQAASLTDFCLALFNLNEFLYVD